MAAPEHGPSDLMESARRWRGGVGTKLGGRPRPLRGLDPSLVPEPRTQIKVT